MTDGGELMAPELDPSMIRKWLRNVVVISDKPKLKDFWEKQLVSLQRELKDVFELLIFLLGSVHPTKTRRCRWPELLCWIIKLALILITNKYVEIFCFLPSSIGNIPRIGGRLSLFYGSQLINGFWILSNRVIVLSLPILRFKSNRLLKCSWMTKSRLFLTMWSKLL